MKNNFYSQLVLPAALLAGTIIGAGVFALPYVFEKAGLIAGLFYLAIFSAVFVLIHLMYADVISSTQGKHHFVGYAEIYLGKASKWLAILMTIVEMILILTVYLILSISFVNLIYPGLSEIYKILIFWFIGSISIILGINRLAISEFLITLGIAAIILIIFLYGFNNLATTITAITTFNLNYVFLPYGAVLFALSGRVAIPALLGYFKKKQSV